jgi:hypothetical protein
MYQTFATLIHAEMLRLESHIQHPLPVQHVPSTFRTYRRQRGILSRYKTHQYLGITSFIKSFLF